MGSWAGDGADVEIAYANIMSAKTPALLTSFNTPHYRPQYSSAFFVAEAYARCWNRGTFTWDTAKQLSCRTIDTKASLIAVE